MSAIEGEKERMSERERGKGPSIGKNVKATFSPIVARNRLLALRATIAGISVLRISFPLQHSARPGLFRVVHEGLLFLCTACNRYC